MRIHPPVTEMVGKRIERVTVNEGTVPDWEVFLLLNGKNICELYGDRGLHAASVLRGSGQIPRLHARLTQPRFRFLEERRTPGERHYRG